MIKLQDFAKLQGVTDRAVQKHLKTYAEELEGLYQRKGPNGTWLTDEACEILRGKMKQAPIVISNTSEELEDLRLENKRLLQALNAAKDRVIVLQDQNKDLALENAKIARLEADNEAARVKAAQADKNAQEARDELTEARRVMQKDLDDAIAAFNQRTKELEDEVYLKQQENERLLNTKLLKRIFGWKKEK